MLVLITCKFDENPVKEKALLYFKPMVGKSLKDK